MPDRADAARNPGVTARVRYRLDLALSRGSLAVIGYLAAITLLITVAAALLLTVLHLSGINGGPRLAFPEAFWQSMLRMLGRGSFASDQHWITRALSLVVTLVGIFLAGALIALISASVNQRITRLRKGRSPVLETGHTLILGWSPRLPVILAELIVANANRRRAAVVILAERPKDEMEDELHRRLPHPGTTRIVCRTGDPSKPADLALVSALTARSIVVLADDDGDAAVLKSVLAVRALDPDFTRTKLVAEFASAEHADTLRGLIDNRIATVQAEQVISQVTAQACHQIGLAGVFRDLLGFDGDAVYITQVPGLAGHQYGDALLGFENSAVLGLCRAGRVVLNPPASFRFADGDEVIAVSADDDTVTFAPALSVPVVEVPVDTPFVEPPRRIAIVGWSHLGTEVLAELDQVLGDGSRIELFVENDHVKPTDLRLPPLSHCTAEVRTIGRGPQALLDAIGTADYDQAIVLGYRHHGSAAKADAHTMLTLMTMHKAWHGLPNRPRVVAELLDRSNIEIARTIHVDDFIVSDELSSLMLAQVSERFEVQEVFRELFTTAGAFISLRPASLYAPQHETSFAAVTAAASRRGESALGYQMADQRVALNPAKSTRLTLGPDDAVLVLGGRAVRTVPGAVAAPAAETAPAAT